MHRCTECVFSNVSVFRIVEAVLLVSQSNNAKSSDRNKNSTSYKSIIQFWRLFIANEGNSNIDKNMCEPNVCPSPNYHYIFVIVDSHFSILQAFSKGCQLNAKWLSYEQLNARVSQLQLFANWFHLIILFINVNHLCLLFFPVVPSEPTINFTGELLLYYIFLREDTNISH